MKEIVSVTLQPTECPAVVLEKTELLKVKGGCGANDKGDKRRRKTGN